MSMGLCGFLNVHRPLTQHSSRLAAIKTDILQFPVLRCPLTSYQGKPQAPLQCSPGVHALPLGGISPRAYAPVLPLLFQHPLVGGLPTFLHADLQLFSLLHCRLLCAGRVTDLGY